jgi:ribA/ribD-fused uncharacterized protein
MTGPTDPDERRAWKSAMYLLHYGASEETIRNIMNPPIISFTGRYAFLSNFHPSPVRILVGGDWVKCATVEHAYQASKTLNKRWRTKIIECPTPGAAKRMGNKIDKVVYWDDVKRIVMLELLRQKFSRAKFRHKLLATGGSELVEGNNWHDTFWGVCMCGACEIETTGDWRGENWLGRLLERVRADVRRGQYQQSHTRTRL